MEQILRAISDTTALVVEAVAVVLISYGALETILLVVTHVLKGHSPTGWRKELFVRFGVWLLLGLQFALAADIVRSVIAPTWNDIGRLAAIAAIRTFLNYFLEHDIEQASHEAA
jgi:uncharacterized membrane protein